MWQKIFRSTKSKKLTLTGLDNQDGQIAIFIALIFQILFIFFAMLINIGLIVHDKINLQNSVDLAAYYGAERQAELLNEIAHINYQIRQDYKLLAWRNQILGTYTYSNNIIQTGSPQPPPDALDPELPTACLSHSGWEEIYKVAPNPSDQITYCNQPITSKPEVPAYAAVSTVPVSGALSSYLNRVAIAVADQCKAVGPRDWYYASLWFYGYKQAVYNRASEIRAIAMNLSKKGTLFQDRKLSLVFDGVKNTFLKNLTDANRSSIVQQNGPPKDFEFINSLSADVPGGCDSAPTGTPNWLHENRITPMPTYTDASGSGNSNSACSTNIKFLRQIPPLPAGYDDPILKAIVSGEPAPTVTSGVYSSLGFEKNPWCLAYVGVRAKTKPRKPFAPFGTPITLEARAFASPFGGRIGPWNHEKWSPGSVKSDSGDLVDLVANPRTEEAPSPPTFEQAVPNYSRYPGDKIGLRSKLAHYLFARAGLMNAFPKNQSPSATHFKFEDYRHLGSDSDVLPQATINNIPVNPAKPTGLQFLRMMENAAVAPDLFDITYYSIDADYYTNYFSNTSTTGSNNAPFSDVGSSKDNNAIERNWNIKEQMKIAKALLVSRQIAGVNWLVPSLDYLLTGWTQGKAGDYPTNPPQFAECMIHPNYSDGWPAVPGYCVVGGRTGYSVRLISRHYLKAKGGLELGGPGVKGGLTNPPPSGW